MAFLGKDPTRSKICINNNTLEQVSGLHYIVLRQERHAIRNLKI